MTINSNWTYAANTKTMPLPGVYVVAADFGDGRPVTCTLGSFFSNGIYGRWYFIPTPPSPPHVVAWYPLHPQFVDLPDDGE